MLLAPSRPDIIQQLSYRHKRCGHHGTIIISRYDRSTELHYGKAVSLFLTVGQQRNCC